MLVAVVCFIEAISLRAQSLAPEQQAVRLRQVSGQKVAERQSQLMLINETPNQKRERLTALAEVEAISPWNITEDSVVDAMVTTLPYTMMSEGVPIVPVDDTNNSGGEEGIFFGGSSSQQLFMDCGVLPPFDSGQWLVSVTYPWSLCYCHANPTNGYGISSFTSANYPNNNSALSLLKYQGLTNDFDANGIPEAHQLSFSYLFFRYSGGDSFNCTFSYIDGVNGTTFTNLPVTSGVWSNVVWIVPPMTGNSLPALQFFVYRGAGDPAHYGPEAMLDPKPEWCVLHRSPGDLWIVKSSETTVVVNWHTWSYPTNQWKLQYAGDVAGPYVTTNVVATISNNVASVPFIMDDRRFYRLKYTP